MERPISNNGLAADIEVAELVTRPKAVRLRATGLMLENAVLGAVEAKLDVTQHIAFGEGK